MLKSELRNGEATALISDEEVTKLVAEQLPRWKAACDDPEVDNVLLSQKAFGGSLEEALLLAVAVKYAAIAKKTVAIIP